MKPSQKILLTLGLIVYTNNALSTLLPTIKTQLKTKGTTPFAIFYDGQSWNRQTIYATINGLVYKFSSNRNAYINIPIKLDKINEIIVYTQKPNKAKTRMLYRFKAEQKPELYFMIYRNRIEEKFQRKDHHNRWMWTSKKINPKNQILRFYKWHAL